MQGKFTELLPKLFVCACLLWLAYRIATADNRRWKRHFQIIEDIREIESRYRDIRAGLVLPYEDEKFILDLSNYEFERLIYRMYYAYPKAREIAETKWNKYLFRRDNEIDFIRVETSYPTEDRVIYSIENQSFKSPTDKKG
jgi:hypothetical protein